MSSVSGVGVAPPPDLLQYLQSLYAQNSTSSSTGTASTLSTASSLADTGDASSSLSVNPNTDPTATSAQAPHKGHHHHHGVSGQIESAVTNALQSAPSGSDPNQVVKNAIAQVLGGSNDTTNGTAGASNIAGGSSSESSFTQLLASYGIDGKQFQQDLQAAIPGGTNGSVDFAKLFQSFPPGSAIETTG